MDELIFPPPSPVPLIVPRRMSIHGNNRNNQKGSSPPLDESKARYYYYIPPTPPTIQNQHSPVNNGNGPATESASTNVQSLGTIQAHSRRHSVATGSVANNSFSPRHAVHWPVMKFNPEAWRAENHQRDIYRLMHEGREEEVRKRRNMKAIMDTSEDEDDDNEMPDLASTIDLGGFKAAEEREKERIRAEVREEWNRTVARVAAAQQEAVQLQRRRSWSGPLDQQQLQQQQQQPLFLQQQQQPSFLQTSPLQQMQQPSFQQSPPSQQLNSFQQSPPLQSPPLQQVNSFHNAQPQQQQPWHMSQVHPVLNQQQLQQQYNFQQQQLKSMQNHNQNQSNFYSSSPSFQTTFGSPVSPGGVSFMPYQRVPEQPPAPGQQLPSNRASFGGYTPNGLDRKDSFTQYRN